MEQEVGHILLTEETKTRKGWSQAESAQFHLHSFALLCVFFFLQILDVSVIEGKRQKSACESVELLTSYFKFPPH